MCSGRQETWDYSPLASSALLLVKSQGPMTQTPSLECPLCALGCSSALLVSFSPSDEKGRMVCAFLLPPPCLPGGWGVERG